MAAPKIRPPYMSARREGMKAVEGMAHFLTAQAAVRAPSAARFAENELPRLHRFNLDDHSVALDGFTGTAIDRGDHPVNLAADAQLHLH